MVAIVSGALLSDIDVVFVGRTRERDLDAVCKKTQNTHNDWDAREAFEASEKIERNIRARVSAAREDASITISGKKKEEFTIVLNTFKRRDLLQRSFATLRRMQRFRQSVDKRDSRGVVGASSSAVYNRRRRRNGVCVGQTRVCEVR